VTEKKSYATSIVLRSFTWAGQGLLVQQEWCLSSDKQVQKEPCLPLATGWEGLCWPQMRYWRLENSLHYCGKNKLVLICLIKMFF